MFGVKGMRIGLNLDNVGEFKERYIKKLTDALMTINILPNVARISKNWGIPRLCCRSLSVILFFWNKRIVSPIFATRRNDCKEQNVQMTTSNVFDAWSLLECLLSALVPRMLDSMKLSLCLRHLRM